MFSHVFTMHSKNSSKFLVLKATMLDKSPEQTWFMHVLVCMEGHQYKKSGLSQGTLENKLIRLDNNYS